ncbi:MAG: dienelactone hydrolase family protein [Proteobacteria bacterium]|nr:dienelactone hydrolase family protein [Pseudomonadota bacterium]
MSIARAPVWLPQRLAVGGRDLACVTWLPPAYDPARAWPLVLFLHGKGERGDDGWAPTTVGLGPALRRHPERWPVVVVFPQCPVERRWVELSELLELAWAAVAAERAIDARRVYLTGISMGGFGTWHHGARCAERLAALLPICGGGDPQAAGALATLPIWALHGAADPVIPVEASRAMVGAVRAAGGPIHYTEYADAGHDCWDRAYEDESVVAWLLAQRRAAPPG